MRKKDALTLIGSYVHDRDIPADIKIRLIIEILKQVGVDYSYEEDF